MFEEFYGLKGKPFQLTPDPAFFYRSITHRKALSYLGYGLAQGEGFIVITGEVGSGKSTLVAHLVDTVDPEQLTVGQAYTGKLDSEDIVHIVAQGFGLAVEGMDKTSTLTEIEAFLHEEAREGRRCLLVVDEAQNLSVSALEELRMLSNFQLGNHPLLQTLLLGQPEFRKTLQTDASLEQLRQRVIAAHHLDAMQEEELEPYMTHRLTQVGWNGLPSFEPDVFHKLYRASGGIPRRINQIANRLLLQGALEEQSHIEGEMLDIVLDDMKSEKSAEDVNGEQTPVWESANQPAAQLDPKLVEDLLTERDAKIAELQEAVLQLASQQKADEEVMQTVRENDELRQKIARIEAKMFEQERTIRQTLTMLIEWIEAEMDESQAA
ncbi:general secretion pathway protein [Altericroceibacterium spongiae]|uniref:General secretion pathway protein n=1 Tax=Altericroceibacterium spongiae TaxID=2320269 RepID=A0A420ERD3_9SPHN|nr:XrtA/PEP-CTERM system-associated ATPase [Altericroceibacterium spongiae]RKF23242.1 general secretion pathway protein [Altericroceibacterium spongiae]